VCPEAALRQEEIHMIESVHVVINPASGQPEPVLHTLNEALHPAGIDWDVSITHASGDAKRAAAAVAGQGAGAVAVYGGDGTVMEVAEGLMGSDVPLAILPGGTANVMSQELGISKKLAEAVAVLVDESSHIREVDLGKTPKGYFILRALAGFSAARQVVVDRPLKDKYGMLAYQIGFVRQLENQQSFKCTLEVDGEVHEADAATVNVYNSANVGIPGISIVPAKIDDGLFDVLAIRDVSALQALDAAQALARGSESEHFLHVQGREVSVECDPPQPVVADGEDVGTTPLEAEVVQSAVRIIAPATN
jgi:YegS/Rv2252/BmrU family lipid kinase